MITSRSRPMLRAALGVRRVACNHPRLGYLPQATRPVIKKIGPGRGATPARARCLSVLIDDRAGPPFPSPVECFRERLTPCTLSIVRRIGEDLKL